MRVSIVTPSYNQAAYLEQTILSVLEQEGVEIEYWVIDGGSTDGSLEIIQRYASRLAGWVSEKDRGQGDAINKGFARATGDVIAWINSDDYYLPGAVRAAVEVCERFPECGLVYGDLLSVNEKGEPFNVQRYAQWDVEGLMQFNILGQPGVFMRRNVQVQAGMLDPTYHYMLDHHLWLRMAMRSGTRYMPQPWAAARFHAQAKNIAQGAAFGAESYRIIAWMQTQPELAERYQRLRRRIWAGARCFDAHYLLDAGNARGALKCYGRSLLEYPPTALRYTRRMAYATASLFFDLQGLKAAYLERRKRRVSEKIPPP